MEHEFEAPPASPAIKVAAGIIVVLVVAVVSHLAGFVDLGLGGGNDGNDRVEVSDNDTDRPGTTDVPETLAFDEDGSDSLDSSGTELPSDGDDSDTTGEGGDSATQPTVVERIELNPEVNASTSTTSTSTSTTSTTEVPESSSTTDPEENTSTTEAPELDENGDPIEEDPASDYQPVIRNYGDNDGGSS